MSNKTTNKQAAASEELTQTLADAADTYRDMLNNFVQAQSQQNIPDPLGVTQTFLDTTAALMKQPEKLAEAQLQFWQSCSNLWLDNTRRWLGEEVATPLEPEKGDRRFKHAAWDSNPFFDFIKQSYLVTANSIQSVVEDIDGLDEKTAHRARFYTKQFVDAMSPSNFALMNPEVLEATVESKGENLLRGLQNFIDDFDAEKGELKIKMSDRDAFELGRNVATTPGKVVFQNDMLQLLHYTPTTEEVYKTPLLIIPPWINKFYVMDLQAKNSMIKWLVDQGHSVFVISWVNPDAALGDKDFADYVLEGALAAMQAVTDCTGEEQINAAGYCIGGTLLAATVAYLQAQQDNRIKSATFFASMLDFSEPGDLGVFIDEEQLGTLEEEMNEKGFHDGAQMSMAFNMLRANDLIWSFYVHNYLLGREPFPFDLLYWNSDSTRLPAKMHSTYLRTMYLENKFRQPGGISIDDVPIDLSSIQTPAYFISTEEDHIAPWKSTYSGAQLFSGPVRFVLGRSGHIAGIINHPDADKYGYHTGGAIDVTADEWHQQTDKHPGSWWPDWNQWLLDFAGEKVPARLPGTGKLPALEDAPGSYVKVRVDAEP
ncbi:MAG: class I poly(R)-hydroxyalkanoic acid synthase [Gammaproteobacteria bacterium]